MCGENINICGENINLNEMNDIQSPFESNESSFVGFDDDTVFLLVLKAVNNLKAMNNYNDDNENDYNKIVSIIRE